MSRLDVRIADSANRLDREVAEPEGRQVTLDLGRIVAALRRQRLVVAAWLTLALVLGLLHLVTTPPRYQAWATVLLTDQAGASIEEVSTVESREVPEIAIENALQVLGSRRLAERVARDLGLTEDPSLLSEEPSGLATLIGGARGAVGGALGLIRGPEATSGTAAPDADAQADLMAEAVAQALQGRLRVSRIGRSSAIALGFDAQSPDLPPEIVNAFVDAYSDDLLEANQAVNEQASIWLGERLDALGEEAQEAAIAVERFRAENGLLESGEGLVTTESVRQLNQEYSIALGEEARSRAIVNAYEALLAMGPAALDDPDARVLLPAGDEGVSALRQTYDGLVARRDGVVEDFGANHPEAIRLNAEVEDVAERLFDEVAQAAAAARGELDVATGRLGALRETLGGAVATSATAGEALVELRALEQRAGTVSTLYEALLVQSERASQQRTLPVSDLRVLSYAVAPLAPSSPSTIRTLGLALVLGTMAAMLHAASREWRDGSIRTGADVTDRLGRRFLGYLPTMPGLPASPPAATTRSRGPDGASADLAVAPASASLALPALQSPRSHFAETLRNIRLASDLAWAGGQGGRIIGVTSIRSDEGKSTVAANLAAVLASGGQLTLLVDADPREAGLTRSLGLVGHRGLASVALSAAPVEGALTRIAESGVDVLGCEGSWTGSAPFDLLASPLTHRWLADARAAFDYIVLDLAPLGPVVDARLLLPCIDQLVLVADWGRTPRQQIAYALAHEPPVADRLLGIVLNRVDLRGLARYAPPDMLHGTDARYGGTGAMV